MHEMNQLKSVSLLVGTGDCNAYCKHCAGLIHRRHAPMHDGWMHEELISATINDCYDQGARSLSISSSGEPTLSPLTVTRTLELICESRVEYSPINLYSNGIMIGENLAFCASYLQLWKRLGLTTVYITVHDVDEKRNAMAYGIDHYPSLDDVFLRIHESDLSIRANLVLSKDNIGTFEKYVSMIEALQMKGVDYISAWPIRTQNDEVDANLSPLEDELTRMAEWTANHGRATLHSGRDRTQYETNQKLTLFPDGTLSSSWCNH